jgi:hypothetical protein
MRSLLGRAPSSEVYRKYVTCLLMQCRGPNCNGLKRLVTRFAVLGRPMSRSSGDFGLDL